MSKKVNSENGETPNDDEDKVTSKDDKSDSIDLDWIFDKDKSDSIDLDWIFDKGWLRTKK